MKRSTTSSLALISLAIALALSSCARQTYSPMPVGSATRYALQITAPQAALSGIMILKPSDRQWQGRMINEFGIGIFDLVATPGKCKLHNVMPMIDKWYIRMTVESDLAFLIWKSGSARPDKSRTVDRLPDGSFTLTNAKRKIRYAFRPLP